MFVVFVGFFLFIFYFLNFHFRVNVTLAKLGSKGKSGSNFSRIKGVFVVFVGFFFCIIIFFFF